MTISGTRRTSFSLDRAKASRKAADTVGIGVVGYGYWGPNLVRNFSEAPGATVAAISDLSEARRGQAVGRYPSAEVYESHLDLINDPDVDAVVVATPVASHFGIAMEALHAGKHVLVEKPLAMNSEEAEALIAEADRRELVLMVDHTFVYTGAVEKIRELVASGDMGRLYYYDSVRVNLGMFQRDVNVLWDLAVHDLSIMDYVLGTEPLAVSAIGAAHIADAPQNTAYLTCFFPDDLLAHFHVNWLSPVKIRRTMIGGADRMILYDDLEPSEKVKVYDKGVVFNGGSARDLRVDYRAGDMWAPRLGVMEALQSEARHFLHCIREGERPISDGRAGLRVLRLLEAAADSLATGGRPVEIQPRAVAS